MQVTEFVTETRLLKRMAPCKDAPIPPYPGAAQG